MQLSVVVSLLLACMAYAVLATNTDPPLAALAEVLAEAEPTLPPPPRRYPVRKFLGNLYHRFRSNRTPMLLIPPLLRIAYQFGGPLLERMSSALGLGQQVAGAGGGGALSPSNSLVNAAVGNALSPAASSPIGTNVSPFGSLGLPQYGGFIPPLGPSPLTGFGNYANPAFGGIGGGLGGLGGGGLSGGGLGGNLGSGLGGGLGFPPSLFRRRRR